MSATKEKAMPTDTGDLCPTPGPAEVRNVRASPEPARLASDLTKRVARPPPHRRSGLRYQAHTLSSRRCPERRCIAPSASAPNRWSAAPRACGWGVRHGCAYSPRTRCDAPTALDHRRAPTAWLHGPPDQRRAGRPRRRRAVSRWCSDQLTRRDRGRPPTTDPALAPAARARDARPPRSPADAKPSLGSAEPPLHHAAPRTPCWASAHQRSTAARSISQRRWHR